MAVINTYFVSSWFFGYDVALEAAFAVICLIVAFFAFRAYKMTGEKRAMLFGTAFLLIAFSYVVQSLFNFLIVSNLNKEVCRVISMQSVALFNLLGIYTHIIFMTFGLVLLAYMTLKVKKERVLWLLIAVSLLTIIFSKNTLLIYALLATVYLLVVAWYYIENYLQNNQKKTLLIAAAFLFLLFGNIQYIFYFNNYLFYVLGHILELFAYLLVLWNLYLVQKHE